MREWEDRAKDIIKESKARVEESPEDYPLGWEENALFNLEQELEEEGIFVGDNLIEARISIAQQIINNVKGT